MRKLRVLVSIMVATAPLAWASSGGASEPCPGYTYLDGIGRACPQPDGTYMVMSPDGRPLGPVSHTDPVPEGPEPILVRSASDVQCVSASEPFAVWVIYARASNDADNYAARATTIRNLVANAQQLVSDAAQATGGTSKLKVLCDANGQVDVKNEVLPTSLSGDNFDTIVNDLQNKGYNDDDKKYWVFYDETSACSCAGTGHWYNDASDSVNNYNNGNYPDPFFAVNFGYDSTRTWLHELTHTLGGAQNAAPYSTGAGHCTDGRDVLCYDDNGPNSGACQDFYCTGTCAVEVWDCNRNTYYNLNPGAGTWLSNHWNIGKTYVRYLSNVRNFAPTMTSLSCAPSSGVVGDLATCTFNATDSTSQIAYQVDWGDGTAQRVPATGYVASGTALSAERTYGWDGTFTVSVSAMDNDPAPLTSAPLTSTITLQAAPVMAQLSCTPSPAELDTTVTCSVRASDNSSGVYYEIDWGDGTPIERVPPTGTVAPGDARTATHAWSTIGSYQLSATATDNGSPALTSAAMAANLSVIPNEAPVIALLSCAPNPVQAENPTTCSFRASDQSGGVYYEIDWGDGATERVPSAGTVTPGVTQTASHTYTTSATFSMSVVASDIGTPPLSSATSALNVSVTPANLAPAMESVTCDVVGYNIPTTCTLRATDPDSTGVKYTIAWGDGSTSVLPVSGYAAQGADFAAQHGYGVGGTFELTVSATDSGSPARTSEPMTYAVTVSGDTTAPSLEVREPFLHLAYYGCQASQNIVLGDPLYVLRGCVKAIASDASGVDNVTVRLNGAVVAVDNAAPFVIDFEVPRGLVDAVLTVTAYDRVGNARSASMRVDTL